MDYERPPVFERHTLLHVMPIEGALRTNPSLLNGNCILRDRECTVF